VDVDFFVKQGLLDRGAHAGAGREVDNGIRSRGHRGLNVSGAADIASDKPKTWVPAGGCQVADLDLHIVEVVEVVEGHDLVPLAQQRFAQMRPDEPGAAGDQNTSHTL
jgi:hypothetical protein